MYCEHYAWCAGVENREYSLRDRSIWPRDTLYPQKFALTSPKSGGRLVGIDCSRTLSTEFSFMPYVIHCSVITLVWTWAEMKSHIFTEVVENGWCISLESRNKNDVINTWRRNLWQQHSEVHNTIKLKRDTNPVSLFGAATKEAITRHLFYRYEQKLFIERERTIYITSRKYQRLSRRYIVRQTWFGGGDWLKTPNPVIGPKFRDEMIVFNF
jgi:hypothetical protein